jgi:8-amino-7-oxononanoate synthase
MTYFESYDKCVSKLKETNLYRQISFSPQKNGSLVADFTHNDYLGLSQNPFVIQRAQEYAVRYGVGGRCSRILCHEKGDLYLRLEEKIARSKKTESALIFNSGYQANATVLACLLDKSVLGEEPLVFSDRLNHASLHHGIQKAGCRQIRYNHLDMEHLETLLKVHRSSSRPKFIVTETLFGMDGDVANLEVLTQLASHYGAFLYVDEAHATGLFGEGGYGFSSAYGDGIHLSMGTFSKAIGASGGYVACSQKLQDYLVNRCTGFMFTTAPSPMVIGAVDAAWDLLPMLDKEREHLMKHAQDFREELKGLQGNVGVSRSSTHIIPIILKDPQKCLKIQKILEAQGILVSVIRPPTVPPNTSRLRLGIGSMHSWVHTQKVIDVLKEEEL